MKKIFALCLGLAFAGGALAGCGGHKHTTAGKKSPAWIDQGGGTFKDSEGNRVLYGVGIVQNVRNVGLARQTVDNRAIADIAKTIQTYSTQMLEDYQSSVNDGGAVSDEAQMLEGTIKTFAEVTLSGVTVIQHWTDHETNTYYALARLDMESFKGMLEKSNKLSEEVKAHIRKNAEAAFDRMAKMEESH